MKPCAEPSHASVGAPCTTRRLDCPDAMPSATRAGRVLRGLLMHSRQSYTAVRSAPFSLHSRPLSAASEPASLPPTVVTVPRCVTIVESAGLWRTADGSLILRWREQPLAALTDGMMQSPYHAVRHLRQSRQAVARAGAWGSGAARRTGPVATAPCAGAPRCEPIATRQCASPRGWPCAMEQSRRCMQISTVLINVLSTLDQGMLRRNHAS